MGVQRDGFREEAVFVPGCAVAPTREEEGGGEKVVLRVCLVNSDVCYPFPDSGGEQVLDAGQFMINNSLCSPNSSFQSGSVRFGG